MIDNVQPSPLRENNKYVFLKIFLYNVDTFLLFYLGLNVHIVTV